MLQPRQVVSVPPSRGTETTAILRDVAAGELEQAARLLDAGADIMGDVGAADLELAARQLDFPDWLPHADGASLRAVAALLRRLKPHARHG